METREMQSMKKAAARGPRKPRARGRIARMAPPPSRFVDLPQNAYHRSQQSIDIRHSSIANAMIIAFVGLECGHLPSAAKKKQLLTVTVLTKTAAKQS
jgi:hypothetical protein